MQSILIPGLIHPVIVICRSTQCIQFRAFTFTKHLLAVVYQAVQSTLFIIKYCYESIAFHTGKISFFRHFRFSHRSCYFLQRRIYSCCFHRKLFFHLYKAFLSPRFILSQQELYFYEIFTLRIQRCEIIRNSIADTFPRTYDITRATESRTFLYFLAIFIERPYHLITTQRSEVSLIEYFNFTFCHVNSLDTYILVDFLYFVVLRFRTMTREKDSVHTEHTAVGFITEVITISQITVTGLRIISIQGLIHPVPDSSTAEEVC